MEWWDKVTFPLRKVWISVATRLGIRKSGLLKLRHDVRRCEYEDVRVMWEMLNRNESSEISRSPSKKRRKRPLWKIVAWARHAPCMCRGF